MPCLQPQLAYRSLMRNEVTGARPLVFKATASLIEGQLIRIPCGQCMSCKIARAQEWAIRCMHEAQLYEDNSFITLTFSDEHLPEDYSIHVRDYQLFMKRLRRLYSNKIIRTFYSGEYTPKNLRPHYHALLFNHDFNDKVFWNEKRGNKLYISNQLQQLWPYGFSTIGTVTPQSAGYVARYNMKKINGPKAAQHYARVHPITARLCQVEPEFLRMSNRPGIGQAWVDRFKSDFYPSDFVIVDGRKCPVPRYYTKLLTEEEQAQLKSERKLAALPHKDNNTRERLKVREQVLAARLMPLKRTLEDD